MLSLTKFAYKCLGWICRTEDNINYKSAFIGGTSLIITLYWYHHFLRFNSSKLLVIFSFIFSVAGLGIFLLATVKCFSLKDEDKVQSKIAKNVPDSSKVNELHNYEPNDVKELSKKDLEESIPEIKPKTKKTIDFSQLPVFLKCIYIALKFRDKGQVPNEDILKKFENYDEDNFRIHLDSKALKEYAFCLVGFEYLRLFFIVIDAMDKLKCKLRSKKFICSKCIEKSELQELIRTFMHKVDMAHNLEQDYEIKSIIVYPIEVISFERISTAYSYFMSIDRTKLSPSKNNITAMGLNMLFNLQKTRRSSFRIKLINQH